MKVVFFGSSSFVGHILENLNTSHTVVAVVTTPDAPAGRNKRLTATSIAVRAEQFHLPVLKPTHLKSGEVMTTLRSLDADFFVVASYGKIIPQTILDLPKFGSLNIHPSLLPKYRGPTPMQQTLINGDAVTGVTIIKMDSEVDHGPIVAQAQFPIGPDETFFELAPRLFGQGGQLLLESLEPLAHGTLIPREQNHDHATFTSLLSKKDGLIDWQRSAPTIYNQYRGLIEWPGTWTTWNNQNLKILECRPLSETTPLTPGTVTERGSVSCGHGSLLQIKTLQLAGKNPLSITNFLHGYPAFRNALLGN